MIVVDRIEGQVAVVELDKETFIDVPLGRIEGNTCDGAVLRRTAEGYEVDEKATAKRRATVQKKASRLFKRKS